MILRGRFFSTDFFSTLILSIYLIINKLDLIISFLNSTILLHLSAFQVTKIRKKVLPPFVLAL
jgi:hypothetical protein